MRARIVLYAAEGLGNDEIAARLDTPRQVVSKWRRRFFDQRLAGLGDLPGGGRPPAFPPEVVVAVKALACELLATTGVPLTRRGRSRAAGFQACYQQITTPFEWKFTKSDPGLLLKRLAAREPAPALAA